MKNNFNDFVANLKELFDADESFCTVIDEELDSVEYNETANNLSTDACKYLICSDGRVNYNNKRILENNGFKVYPGDKDSFGWLVGVIERNDRKLVFG